MNASAYLRMLVAIRITSATARAPLVDKSLPRKSSAVMVVGGPLDAGAAAADEDADADCAAGGGAVDEERAMI